jgi:hypothetical protein
MISPIYRVKNTGPLTVTKAKTWINAYGIACKVEVSTFVIHGMMGIRMQFEPDPESNRLVKGARHTTRLFFKDTSAEGTREVEQHIKIYPTVSEVISITDMSSFDDEQVEQLAASIIRSFKSIINYSRESIYSTFAEGFRDRACEFLDQNYLKKTEESVSGVLSSLNFPLLFQNVAVPENFVDRIESTINEHNEALAYPLLYEGEIDADILSSLSKEDNIQELVHRILQEEERERRQRKYKNATKKARDLLKRVCGEDIYKEYLKTGDICVEKDNGWTFYIGRGYSILVLDPQGREASLCVHTAGASCHKIDEIVIAYLHIMHDCDDFLARAIVHNRHPDFDMQPFRRKAEKRIGILNE